MISSSILASSEIVAIAKKTQMDAFKLCEKFGLRLITDKKPKKHNTIQEYAVEMQLAHGVQSWIDAYITSDYTVKTSSGKVLEYTPFAPNQTFESGVCILIS